MLERVKIELDRLLDAPVFAVHVKTASGDWAISRFVHDKREVLHLQRLQSSSWISGVYRVVPIGGAE